MDLDFTAQERAFELEVQRFLAEALPASLAAKEALGFHQHRRDVAVWHEALWRQGWIAPGWPKQYGGTGWSPIERFLFERACGLANAPEVSLIALSMVGPVLCEFGSDALRQRFLEPILRGELWFCQGFSEPEAGSDLAAVRCRARVEADGIVINGHKIWTTDAHMADFMICLARTADGDKPRDGLSMILIPMDASGVRVRPIATLDGDHHINEVFLEGVEVPRENLVGEANSGWKQARFLLGRERTHNAYVGMLRRYLARFPDLLERQIDSGLDARMAQGLLRDHTQLSLDVEAHEWSVLRLLADEESSQLRAGASAVKIRGSELLIKAAELELMALGSQVIPAFSPTMTEPLPAAASVDALGRVTQALYWRAAAIFGGTNEIQRGIIYSTLFHR